MIKSKQKQGKIFGLTPFNRSIAFSKRQKEKREMALNLNFIKLFANFTLQTAKKQIALPRVANFQ